jgi:predicted phosphodiesterase
LSANLQSILFVPDTHAPFHDKRAWKVMMKAAREFGPDIVIHQGDLIDCYSISRFTKDPRRAMSLRQERDAARRLRADLDSLEPVRKLFIEGNHEDRLRVHLFDRAPEVAEELADRDAESYSDGLLGLTRNGWEFTPYREDTRIGKLWLTHDVGNSGKYTTATALDTYQHSVTVAHHHQLQYLVKGDATGEYQVGAQFGWLGDVDAIDYQHKIKVRSRWALGFGIGYHQVKTGLVYLVPVPIVNYSCCVEGKVYRA